LIWLSSAELITSFRLRPGFWFGAAHGSDEHPSPRGNAMLSRRWFLKFVPCVLAVLVTQRAAADPDTGDANLRETLVFGLRPRLPAETEFIEMVVTKVEQQVLPLELVISTFRWAQGRKPYPMPFFQRALVVRAAKIGISLG
jgi:hypothetical protein